MTNLKCLKCKREFLVQNYRKDSAKYCSMGCKYIDFRGKEMKRSPRKSTQGYMFIKKPEHHRSNKQGYTKIADLVLETKLGRKLKPNEVAHHKNHIRDDDSADNLEVMTKKDHDSLTTKERWEKWRSLNLWSREYKHCVNCHTIEKKHAGRGLCSTCRHYIERGKMTINELKIKQKQHDKQNII